VGAVNKHIDRKISLGLSILYVPGGNGQIKTWDWDRLLRHTRAEGVITLVSEWVKPQAASLW